MSYTTEQVAALKDAVSKGILEAALPDGSRVRYRSLAEMMQLIATLESDTKPARNNVAYPTHSRGFHG